MGFAALFLYKVYYWNVGCFVCLVNKEYLCR